MRLLYKFLYLFACDKQSNIRVFFDEIFDFAVRHICGNCDFRLYLAVNLYGVFNYVLAAF